MAYKRNSIEKVEELTTLRLSPSSINTFRSCPKKWFYNYVLALSSPGTIHTIRGTIVHTVLENIFKLKSFSSGENFRPTIMKSAFTDLDNLWKKDIPELKMEAVEEKKFYDETKIMIERFINRFVDNIQNGIKYGKMQNERQGFYLTRPIFKELWLDDQYLTDDNGKHILDSDGNKIPNPDALIVGGFIDSVQKDFDNNLMLIDYKTSNKYKNVLSEDYVRQLAIYAYLYYNQKKVMPAYVGINYLKFDESYYILVTPSLIQHAISDIKAMRNEIIEFGLNKEKYYKKESKLCDWCFFKSQCIGEKCEK